MSDGAVRYEYFSGQIDEVLLQVKNYVVFFSTLFSQHPYPDIPKLSACLENLKKDQDGKKAPECCAVYETTANLVLNTMRSYKMFLEQMDAQLFKPFNAWLKDSSKAKERMDKDFKSAQKKLSELQKNVKKQEQECLKSLDVVKKNRSDFKLVESTRKKFSAYEIMVQQGVELQKQLYTEIIPKNLKELEAMEAARVALGSNSLPEVSKAYMATETFLKQSNEALLVCLRGLSPPLKIVETDWEESYDPIEYSLPCRDPDIVTGNFESEIQKKLFMGKVEKRRAHAEKAAEASPSEKRNSISSTEFVIHTALGEGEGETKDELMVRRKTATVSSSDEAAKMTRMRDQVAKEVVDTEHTYVANLGVAVTKFLRPLEQLALDPSTTILTKEQIHALFSNIGTLEELNRQFCTNLTKRRYEDWAIDDQMGDLFLKFTPYFKMYATYINNHPAANSLLTTLSKDNSKFIAFLKAQSDQNLAGLLIAPVQRVPRYRLLLEVLLKNTPPEHPDYTNLSKALDSVKEVAVGLNEKAKVIESFNELRDIEASFVGGLPSLITPSRKFVRRGPLIKKCRAKDEEYEFFLFNDLLIYASRVPMSRMFNLHRMIEINSAFKVDHNVDSPTEFTIICPAKIFKVFGVNEEDKAQWLRALTNCMASQMIIDSGARARRTTATKEPEEVSTPKFRTLRGMTLTRKKEPEVETPGAAPPATPSKTGSPEASTNSAVGALLKGFQKLGGS